MARLRDARDFAMEKNTMEAKINVTSQQVPGGIIGEHFT